MRQRLRALLLVTALALAACDGSPADPAGGGDPRGGAKLLVWTESSRIDAVRKVADDYGEARDVAVRVQAISAELEQAFASADAAGNGPDLVVGGHDWIGSLVKQGAIRPLELTPEDLDGYSSTAVRATTYDGELYGLPFGIETVGLYRNTAIVGEERSTMDGVVKAGRAAVRSGDARFALGVPLADGGGDAYYLQGLFTSLGGYIFGAGDDGAYDPTDLGVGRSGSVAAARRLAVLGREGVVDGSLTSDRAVRSFTRGRSAFLVSGPWALPAVRDSGVDYALAPLPGFRDGEPAEPFATATAFMLADKAPHPAAAQEFLAFLSSDEGAMQDLSELTGLPPAMTVVRDAVEDDVATFAEAADAAAPIPANPEMEAVWAPLGRAYVDIVGGAPPGPTMRAAAEEIAAATGGP